MRRKARLCVLLHIDVKKEVQDDETKDKVETQSEGRCAGFDGDRVLAVIAAVDDRYRGTRVYGSLADDGGLGGGVSLS